MTKPVLCILACCLLAACAAPSVTVTDRDPSAAAAWKQQREQDAQRDRQRDLWLKYENDWRAKVEQVGTRLYDAEPAGKPAGNLRLTVALHADGSVRSTQLDRSSGSEVLDDLALRTVKEASPFPPFPAELPARYDGMPITRTWSFGPDVSLSTK
jgi:TonB family protein